jgi:diguanylate cyclase (GGDEF)-like protein
MTSPVLLAADEDRPRILVVDDQPANVQALYQVFAADHQVFMATGGEQALALAAARQPDVVLLDILMPGLDGLEVCARLKADEATRDIPVIFVTSYRDDEAEARGLDAGAVDFITKPINPRVVRARVRTHLTLKRQSDLLRQWVYIDGLTGIRNRRYFDERLTEEWGRAMRQDAPLSLLLIDVDHFKRYNDRHGHAEGDECLRRVAEVLRDALKRPADQLARYGGEEFACLLPDTIVPGALQFADQLVARVRSLAIPHGDSPVSPWVTVSVGLCTRLPGLRPSHGATPATLLQEADAQLYRAKMDGRDRARGSVLPPPAPASAVT